MIRRVDHGGEHGFTVAEVLVALSIMVMVTIPTLMVLRNATTTEAAQTADITATRNGAIAVERMSADIRSATYLQLYTDSLKMQMVDTTGATTTVAWWRDGTKLLRESSSGPSGTSVILDDLTSVNPTTAFVAFDKDGNKITSGSVTCPGYISIDIERNTRAGTDHLQFDVASRNLNAGGGKC